MWKASDLVWHGEEFFYRFRPELDYEEDWRVYSSFPDALKRIVKVDGQSGLILQKSKSPFDYVYFIRNHQRFGHAPEFKNRFAAFEAELYFPNFEMTGMGWHNYPNESSLLKIFIHDGRKRIQASICRNPRLRVGLLHRLSTSVQDVNHLGNPLPKKLTTEKLILRVERYPTGAARALILSSERKILSEIELRNIDLPQSLPLRMTRFGNVDPEQPDLFAPYFGFGLTNVGEGYFRIIRTSWELSASKP